MPLWKTAQSKPATPAAKPDTGPPLLPVLGQGASTAGAGSRPPLSPGPKGTSANPVESIVSGAVDKATPKPDASTSGADAGPSLSSVLKGKGSDPAAATAPGGPNGKATGSKPDASNSGVGVGAGASSSPVPKGNPANPAASTLPGVSTDKITGSEPDRSAAGQGGGPLTSNPAASVVSDLEKGANTKPDAPTAGQGAGPLGSDPTASIVSGVDDVSNSKPDAPLSGQDSGGLLLSSLVNKTTHQPDEVVSGQTGGPLTSNPVASIISGTLIDKDVPNKAPPDYAAIDKATHLRLDGRIAGPGAGANTRPGTGADAGPALSLVHTGGSLNTAVSSDTHFTGATGHTAASVVSGLTRIPSRYDTPLFPRTFGIYHLTSLFHMVRTHSLSVSPGSETLFTIQLQRPWNVFTRSPDIVLFEGTATTMPPLSTAKFSFRSFGTSASVTLVPTGNRLFLKAWNWTRTHSFTLRAKRLEDGIIAMETYDWKHSRGERVKAMGKNRGYKLVKRSTGQVLMVYVEDDQWGPKKSARARFCGSPAETAKLGREWELAAVTSMCTLMERERRRKL